MKPLTTSAQKMIDEAVWYTYAVTEYMSESAYVEERGITTKYTGCKKTEVNECSDDKVIRNNEWTGLIGLMYQSDVVYASGWINKESKIWTITPEASTYNSIRIKFASTGAGNTSSYVGYDNYVVNPTIYLKSDVNIIGGNGNDKPYKLSL